MSYTAAKRRVDICQKGRGEQHPDVQGCTILFLWHDTQKRSPSVTGRLGWLRACLRMPHWQRFLVPGPLVLFSFHSGRGRFISVSARSSLQPYTEVHSSDSLAVHVENFQEPCNTSRFLEHPYQNCHLWKAGARGERAFHAREESLLFPFSIY